MRTAVACARMARSTLGVCSDAALHEARGLAVGESLDALRERVELVGVAQPDEEQRTRHQRRLPYRSVNARVRWRGGARSGPTRRELGRRRLDPDDAEGHVRPVGELVDRAARRPGRAGEAGAEVAEERRRRGREAGRSHEAEPNGVADVQPEPLRRARSWRPPRRPRRGRPLVPRGGASARGRARGGRRSGSIGNRSTGPTRRPSPVRPVNMRLTVARAVDRTWGSALDLVEVDRTREAEVAAPGDDDVGGVHRPAEVAVGVAGAHCAREQAEHHAAGDARDQRHPQPRRPPVAQLRPETQGDRGHRATVPAPRTATGAATRETGRPFRPSRSPAVPHPSRRRRPAPSPVGGGARGSWPPPWSRSQWSVRSARVAMRSSISLHDGVEELRRRAGALAGVRPGPGRRGARTSPSPTTVGPTEVVFPALQAGTYDAYADYQGTLLTYLGGTPTANSAKTHAALVAKLQGTGITVSDRGSGGRRQRLLRHPRRPRRSSACARCPTWRRSRLASRSARPPSARPVRCASVTHHSARTA